MKLSPTAIITYLTCPKRFYLKYILNVKEQYVPQIEKGRKFHEFIEEYYKTIPETIDVNEVNYYVDEVLNYVGISYSEYTNEIQGFINWERWRINNLSDRKPQTEVLVENDTFYGRIDAVFDDIIVEFKTGYVNIQQPNKEMLIQGIIYKELTNAKDVIFVLLRNNGAKHFLSKFNFRLELIKNEIEEAIRGIIEGRFSKEKDENCELCPVLIACRLLKKKYTYDLILD